ncbi:DNA translocase FtsK [Mesobacillus subterraneus]|uniref:DNA translocase FtsK n=1 Tax=Mesobacillus subterraneus TaxID=285983 RepID=A0A3R9ED97_9BACI|nr:DNA translocase FtsK [Mesobacillus subterraneus]RSD27761.1 DNA translocase FtsK [Mesobacillus subterraneus]
MSWIKKIFTRFQNDDDFDDSEQEQPVAKSPKSERAQKKDIEAKVLYQYPKGQFRFPLIPDEELKVERKKERQVKPMPVEEVKPFITEHGSLRIKNERQTGSHSASGKRNEPIKNLGRTISPEPEKEIQPKKAAKPEPKFKFEHRKDSGPKFRQPFKPTEIPSPIYAYNRPPVKTQPEMNKEEVEYELTGFENEVPEVQENDRIYNAIATEALSEVKKSDADEVQDFYIEDDLAESPETEISELDHEEQFDLETEAIDHILNLEPGQDLIIAKEHKTEPKSIESPEMDQEPGIVEAGQYLEELKDAEAHEESINSFVTDSEAVEESMPSLESDSEAAEELEGMVDVRVADDEPSSEHEHHVPQQVKETEDEYNELNIETAEKPAEPKRQLPFNVIMLKQDKRKWEERKMSKYPSFMSEKDRIDEGGQVGAMNKEANPAQQGNEAFSDQKPSASENLSPAKGMAEEQTAAENTAPSSAQQQAPLGEKVSEPPVHAASATAQPAGTEISASATAQPADTVIAASHTSIPHVSSQDARVSVNPAQHEVHPAAEYDFPPLDLLNPPVFKAPDPEWLGEQEHMLNETLRNFNVGARVVNVTQGPSVTRFEVQPEPGVKVNKITNLSDDIKLSLAAKDIRIEAPIPGKHTIGIEVPNHSSRPVLLSEIIQSGGFLDQDSPLSVALGLDIAGNPIVTDLKKMPHGLIAGATGSGKSVCINTMLVSLLYKAHPDDVKLLLIDPKMVELAPYNQIPHLVSPVITDVKAATASLKWAVEEMERRYELFAHTGVRDINRFNELAIKHRRFSEKLPFIVIVIDELADLMMMAPGDVEEAICRIAQKARACGIHLIIATQRPSVDVITGLIKANVPTRIAFSVSSQVDSRTIIDISGAEKLLGRGDMLFLENGSSKPFRLQGTFVTDNEIDDIVAFVRDQRAPQYLFEQEELMKKAQVTEDEDELFYEACEFVIDQGGASTSSVQRRFKIGYNRAARLIEMMEQQGFISEGRGSKPRDVLITAEDLESLQETSTFN